MNSLGLQGWSHQMGYGSQNLTKIYVRRHLWKFPTQLCVPSRAHHNARAGSSGPHPVECSISSMTRDSTTSLVPVPGLHCFHGKEFSPHIQPLLQLVPWGLLPCHWALLSLAVFSVMCSRQWEAVTSIPLSCLLSTLSKLSFTQVIDYVLQNGFS